MNYYSMPSDFSLETLKKYYELNFKYENSKISETYGNVTIESGFASGRVKSQMYKTDFYDLEKYVKFSNDININFNYTLNASYLYNKEFTSKGISEIKELIKRLTGIGIDSFTIALPSLIELVKSIDDSLKIKASAICQINDSVKASSYKEIGVNKIVVEETQNRNFSNLKSIRNIFGDQVELITNVICYNHCIYRPSHYNMMTGDIKGHINETSVNYFEHRCVLQQYNKISNLLRLGWIRPEDIKFYNKIGINHFKLQGRHTFKKGGDPVKTVEYYLKEDFDGNLMDLLVMFAKLNSFKVYIDNKKLDGFIQPYFENDNFCKKDCTECKYCETFSEKCITHDKAEEIIKMAKKFYVSYDQYNKLISEADNRKFVENKSNNFVEDNNELSNDQGDFNF